MTSWFPAPPEILAAVIAWVSGGAEFDSDYASLVPCGTVCKSWAPLVQRQLFAKIRLQAQPGHQERLRSIAHTLGACFALGSVVRSLWACIGRRGKVAFDDGELVARTVSLCPALVSLHLSLCYPLPDHSPSRFSLGALAIFRQAYALRHLSVHTYVSNPRMHTQLLDALPQVRTLSIDGDFEERDAVPPGPPHLAALNISAHPSHSFLAYIHVAAPYVTAMDLDHIGDVRDTCAPYAAHLRTLAVFSARGLSAASALTHTREFLPALPMLETLVLGYRISRELLALVPQSVTHFGFDPYQCELLDTLAWLAARPRIHTVSTVYDPTVDSVETPEKCEVRRVARLVGWRLREAERVRNCTCTISAELTARAVRV